MKSLVLHAFTIICSIMFTVPAFASEPTICITGSSMASESFDNSAYYADGLEVYSEVYLLNVANEYDQWTCKEIDAFRSGVHAMELTMSIVTVGSACTGVGAPATLGFGLFGVALGFVDFVLAHLPCKSHDDPEVIQKIAIDAVCQVMRQKGMECDPNEIDLSDGGLLL